jgi:UDP-2,4-diacetamido-2,4,6-trideoxy-beta-L-altropyranose hydrolase
VSGQRRLLVRADAGPAIGMGHVMRCLALAQAFEEDGHGAARFAVCRPAPELRARLERAGFVVLALEPDAAAFAALVAAERPDAVVMDGYRFGLEEQRAARSTGAVLAVVDDNREVPLALADLIVNQNAHAPRVDYHELVGERLLGLSFAMLRTDVRRAAAAPAEVRASARRVLISMGGSDPAGATVPLALALAADGALEVRALVGGAAARFDEIRAQLGGVAGVEVVPPQDDVTPLFRWADVVICGAGSTLWELCALGVPSVALTVADNQRELAVELERLGAGVSAGPAAPLDSVRVVGITRALLADPARREVMSAAGTVAIDARGASRVAAKLAALVDARRGLLT